MKQIFIGCWIGLGAAALVACAPDHGPFDITTADVGHVTGGLFGENGEKRFARETAEIAILCAELGIGSAEAMGPHCARMLAGTPDDPALDEYWMRGVLPEPFLAHRAMFVKYGDDQTEYRDKMQAFLERQIDLLAEREAMGPAYVDEGR